MEVLKRVFENKNLLKTAIFLLHLSLILQLMQKTKIHFQIFSMDVDTRVSFYFFVFMTVIIGFVAAYIVALYLLRALTDNFYSNIRWHRKWAATGFAVLMLFIGYVAAQESLSNLLNTFGFFGVFLNYPFRPFAVASGMFPFSYLAIPLVLVCHLTNKNGEKKPSALEA